MEYLIIYLSSLVAVSSSLQFSMCKSSVCFVRFIPKFFHKC